MRHTNGGDLWLKSYPIRAVAEVNRFVRLQFRIPSDRDFESAQRMFAGFEVITIGGADVALEAARNIRHLRAKGITVRKTIDTLIATRCLLDGHALLFSDRDFDPFVEHLGLVEAMG